MPFAAALSTAVPSDLAIDEVCSVLRNRLLAPDLAVIFFSPHHADAAGAIAGAVLGRLGASHVVGAVGEAVAGVGREVEQSPALSVWLGAWNGQIEVEPFHLVPRQTPDGLSLLGWPDILIEGDPANTAMVLFGDPFTFPATEIFLPQVNADHRGLRVLGGMASGMAGPGQTVLLLGSEVRTAGAVGVVLRGSAGIRSVVSQGCRPIGDHFVVTKAHDNVIQELGGKPPLERLQTMFDGLPVHDQQLFRAGPHVGLVINEYQDRFHRGDFLIRNLYSVDRSTGALTITDRVRAGQTVQFQVRDAETADEDLRLLLQQELARASSRPGAALLFSCNGRGTRLFPAPNHDARAIHEEVGDVPMAGFFAAGELGPIGGRNFLHGFTASVVLFDEV